RAGGRERGLVDAKLENAAVFHQRASVVNPVDAAADARPMPQPGRLRNGGGNDDVVSTVRYGFEPGAERLHDERRPVLEEPGSASRFIDGVVYSEAVPAPHRRACP